MGKLGGLSRLHAFPRTEDHLSKQTSTGALVTFLGITTIVVLFIHELNFYMTPYTDYQMGVDSTKRGQQLSIVINITFPALPCQVLSLDALDMSGKHEVDLHTTVFKERIDRNGRTIDRQLVRDLVEGEHKHGHNAAAKNNKPEDAFQLMQFAALEGEETVREIKAALEAHEGCQVYGHLLVQRVAGNFHVSVHGHSLYVLQQVFTDLGQVNVTHYIHQLGFGVEYPGMVNPLDGFMRLMLPHGIAHGGSFKYFLKVVPTEYKHLDGSVLLTNQYSVTEYDTPIYPGDGNLPAVYFMYDLSPIVVNIEEKRRNFLHFITRLCAVLGGTFALTGMLDRWVYKIVQHFSEPESQRGIMSPSRQPFTSTPRRRPL